jgi:hypothetical protein
MLGMFGAVFSLLAWRRPRKQMSRPGYTMFCLALLIFQRQQLAPDLGQQIAILCDFAYPSRNDSCGDSRYRASDYYIEE